MAALSALSMLDAALARSVASLLIAAFRDERRTQGFVTSASPRRIIIQVSGARPKLTLNRAHQIATFLYLLKSTFAGMS